MSWRNRYAPDNLDRPRHWSADAVCRNSEYADLFFSELPLDIQEAKSECRGCPVTLHCLAGALERGEQHGVWGGYSTDERRALFQRRPDAAQWAADAAAGLASEDPDEQGEEPAEDGDDEDQADEEEESGAHAQLVAA